MASFKAIFPRQFTYAVSQVCLHACCLHACSLAEPRRLVIWFEFHLLIVANKFDQTDVGIIRKALQICTKYLVRKKSAFIQANSMPW